ncbi:MAG TPA: hypothetical protein VK202_00930 [Bacteroidia bacterium]|nr:hypothetical protein [Bacteroidia bacterium]
MRLVFASLFIISTTIKVYAQNTPVEIMTGNRNYWYQHVFGKTFNNTRWGFFNVSSLHAFYDDTKGDLMSQSYATFAVTKGIKLGLGTFYSSVPGFKPSLNMQLLFKKKHYALLAIPRVDVTTNPSYDLMSQMEFTPEITTGIKFYSRIQTLFNYTNLKHNRSYQYLRLGLGYKQTQAGVAINADTYGRDKDRFYNIGVFVKKDFK